MGVLSPDVKEKLSNGNLGVQDILAKILMTRGILNKYWKTRVLFLILCI